MNRRRAAALAAVLLYPSTELHKELRNTGVDAVWDRFVRRDVRLPDTVLTRFAALDVDALLRRTEQCGARIIVPGDDEWPVQLDDLGPATPWALWLRGEQLQQQRSVAIVGSRSCTMYGERVAADFAVGIANAGLPIVSGGAFGIDAAAHRGALATSTPTVAVLASGVDVPYPVAHSALFDRIVAAGTLVSESPPGARPMRQAFLIRNRIIAALAYGTVVVEARYRSGALSTYRHASDLNRIVMGVPGPVSAPESGGVHELLKTGAQLVTSADDVLVLVAPLGTVAGEVHAESTGEWDELTSVQRQVYDAFPTRAPISVDALLGALTADIGIGQLLASLTGLAQRGLVAEGLDGAWKRNRRLRGAETCR